MSDVPMHTGSQRKCARGPSAEPSSSTPPKKAQTAPTATRAKKGKHKWSMSASEVPKKAQGLQCALNLHIRVLWQLFTQNDIPPPVAGTLIDNFQKRFESSDDVRTQVDNLISKVAPASAAALAAVTAVQSSAHMGTSQIAKDTKHIDQDHLLAMFTTISNAGLSRWAPDVLGAVESMYNALHEQLALSTFKNVAASFGYTFMNVDLSFLQNHTFLVKLYRNFVFGYMAEKARKDGKAPGCVAKDNDMMEILQTRETRVKQLRDHGFNKRILRLARQNDAHSDDMHILFNCSNELDVSMVLDTDTLSEGTNFKSV
ncbi:hypothetical protein BDP27DRAFT_1430579 [Rhodocollybia butyracea]|uniref:Uncharacterized protein n=1 Tax=Rhodocollybia butyracea TaxID=206335 RepID=A0A9P5PAQ1_9AGAR|nr:hypothetical protein BDP27DRAFT_1430579 [Rhodocollybia butyracea]